MDLELAAADEIFRVVPAHEMPSGPPVVILEIDGQPRYLICEGTPLPVVVAECNRLSTHLIRHGLWRPQQDGTQPPRMRHAG